MTIYNFRFLYDILHNLEEHSACFVNFRYKVVYTFMISQILYAVFGYKRFLTTTNYFRQLCTIYGGHILL